MLIWLADDILLKSTLQSVLLLDIFESLPKCLPFWAEICLILTLAPILLSAFQKNQSAVSHTKSLEGRKEQKKQRVPPNWEWAPENSSRLRPRAKEASQIFATTSDQHCNKNASFPLIPKSKYNWMNIPIPHNPGWDYIFLTAVCTSHSKFLLLSQSLIHYPPPPLPPPPVSSWSWWFDPTMWPSASSFVSLRKN